jgi:hypothetical protein
LNRAAVSYGEGYVTSHPPRLTQLLWAALHDTWVNNSWTQPTGFTKSKPAGQLIVGNTDGAKLGLLVEATVGEILSNTDGAVDGEALGIIEGPAEGQVLENNDGELVAPDAVGSDVTGEWIGATVGNALGLSVGLLVGNILGAEDGDKVGCSEGADVVETLTPVWHRDGKPAEQLASYSLPLPVIAAQLRSVPPCG